MSLQKVSHIEGLEGAFEDINLLDDTDPGAMRIWFEVRAIEIPAKTAQEGKIVRENVVYIFKDMELGHSVLGRKIRDTVKFDETSASWKVIKLADEMHSDILRYPAEWNAFVRGSKPEDVGTPLSVLFKNDPSRALFYKDKHITTIERLAGVNQTDASALGFGASDDIRKAKQYVEKLNSQASNGVAMLSQIEDQSHEISVLRQTIAELQQKLTEVVVNAEEPVVKRGRGRPKKVVEEDERFTA